MLQPPADRLGEGLSMDAAERSHEDAAEVSSATGSEDLRPFVRLVYDVVLGRIPEEKDTDFHAASGSPQAILSSIADSEEARERRQASEAGLSPFHHYAASFDAVDIIRRHARQDLVSDPRYLTNFLGVRIEEHYLPAVLAGKAGVVEPMPIPSNWHADIAEWAAALRAVELAHDSFSIVELGCGWGCWLNNAGVAARNRGLKPMLIGVEGDEGHIAFARRCCSLNGFSSDAVELHHGIAAAHGGTALFPRQETAGEDWGLEPVFGASDEQKRQAVATGRYDVLPMIALDALIGDRPLLDLLHVDIQGGEADLIEQSREVLERRVAYLLVGTHSRVIEGRIAATLAGAPWLLEIERPAIVRLLPGGPVTVVDGVQGWRNMALRPDDKPKP